MIDAEAPASLYLLHRASQTASKMFDAKVREAGLEITDRQVMVLLAVSVAGGSNQKHFVETTGIDRSTLADIMRRLTKKGYVKRKWSREDARAKEVYLSERGEQLLRDVAPVLRSVEEDLARLLPASLRVAFSKALAILARPDDRPD